MDYSLQKSPDDHTVSTTIIDIVIFISVALDYSEVFHTISHLQICSPFDEYNLPFGVIKLSKVYNFIYSYELSYCC